MTTRQYQYELPLTEARELHDDASLMAREQAERVREQGTIDRALAILAARHRRGETLTSPESVKEYLRLKLADHANEVFGCIFLDNRHRIIVVEDMFFGTIDGASVYPRVIAQKALAINAAAAIAYHNHPSGVAEPSQSDLRITTRIKEALALVEVRLLDHIVVAVGECASLAERGLL
jgi:DNA repair protein RadC